MKKIFICLLVTCCFFNVLGQISTNENPIGFNVDKRMLVKSDIVNERILPSINIQKLRQEDIIDEKNGIPPRFGYRHKVNYNLTNSGTWFRLTRKSCGDPIIFQIILIINIAYVYGIKIININSFKLSKKRESKQDNANLTKTYPMYQI